MDFFTGNITGIAKKKPGMKQIIRFAFASDMTTIAGLPAAPTTNAEKVTISDAHVHAASTGFIELEFFPKTATLGDASEGETGSKSQPATLIGFIPESKDAKVLVESDLPVIVLADSGDCSDGESRQLGDACEGAYVSGTFSSGTSGGSDRRGYEITIDASNGWYYYTGAIDLLVP